MLLMIKSHQRNLSVETHQDLVTKKSRKKSRKSSRKSVKLNSETMQNPETAKNSDTSNTFGAELGTHPDLVTKKSRKSVEPKMLQTPNTPEKLEKEDKNVSQNGTRE